MSEINYRALIERLGDHDEVIGKELTRRKVVPGRYTWEQTLERIVVGLVYEKAYCECPRPTYQEWKEQLDRDVERVTDTLK